MGHFLPCRIENPHIDKRCGKTGHDQRIDELMGRAAKHVVFEIGPCGQRTGFRHPVGSVYLYSFFHSRQRQPLVEARTPDDHLPARKIGFCRRRMPEDHLQDGGDAVRVGDLFFFDQPQYRFRLVAAGIHLLCSHQRGAVGHAPGVDMKHGRKRHINIVGTEATDGLERSLADDPRLRVQHELAV